MSAASDSKAIRSLNAYGILFFGIVLLVVLLGLLVYFRSLAALLSTSTLLFIGIYSVVMVILFVLFQTTDWANELLGFVRQVKNRSADRESIRALFATLFAVVGIFILLLLVLGITYNKNPAEMGAPGLLNLWAGRWYWGIALLLLFSLLSYFFGLHNHLYSKDTVANEKGRLLFAGLACFLLIFLCLAAFQQPGVLDTLQQFQGSLKAMLAIGVTLVLFVWFLIALQTAEEGGNLVTRILLNLALFGVLSLFVYRLFQVQLPGESVRRNLLSSIYYFLLYLPCFFNLTLDAGTGHLFGAPQARNVSFAVILISLIGLLALRYYPKMLNPVMQVGGKSVQNAPVPLQQKKILAESLGSGPNLAISFWFYLDAQGPNANAAYTRDALLLSVGETPQVMFHGKLNRLRVVSPSSASSSGKEVLYEATNVPLQRWNHMVLNFNSGILDIFLNNQLVKSVSGYLPHFQNNALIAGEDNGLEGGICNVMLFDAPLTRAKMYLLYHAAAGKSPPTLFSSS